MTTAQIKKIIEQNKNDIAFVIGNGINRYPNNPNAISWDDLLIELWDKVSFQTLTRRPNGISLTEFYDILELENTQAINLQKEVSNVMDSWIPLDHHFQIVDQIRYLNAPILTTNFEETFAKTFQYELLRTDHDGFTDFYPWTTYHGFDQMELPTDGFGIWYINGMIHYHRSIRLGLSHYMGSVERARNFLHKGNEERLFSGKNVSNWKGHKTWLHIVFNKSLFVFGLGLEENETFLRWLLIERIKYFKRFPSRKHKGWYINKRSNNGTDSGKKFFLERVGFEVIDVDDYTDIYQAIWE
ncbi:MAG: hypothetical protein CMH46_10325 [Muricauda sp.]|nr:MULTISPECIES: hypothetical protein [unclassified Allomuricauda]MAU15919.1 hypothetical protein [Allomuricauda sp.]|tara:strand:+ start:3059 stop:3955 length:897 start_codon:yes stop_codon:yes gene_type:complete